MTCHHLALSQQVPTLFCPFPAKALSRKPCDASRSLLSFLPTFHWNIQASEGIRGTNTANMSSDTWQRTRMGGECGKKIHHDIYTDTHHLVENLILEQQNSKILIHLDTNISPLNECTASFSCLASARALLLWRCRGQLRIALPTIFTQRGCWNRHRGL